MERVLILGAKSDIARALAHRFALAGHDIILAARRAKMLMKGATPLVESTNRPIVQALREVAAGKVRFSESREKEDDAALPQKQD